MGSLIIALAGVTALVVLAAWASRKGWIYLGFKRPTGTTSGGLGQIAEAFQPSYSYYAEEKERYHSAVEASGPGLAEDHELLWTLRPATTPNDKTGVVQEPRNDKTGVGMTSEHTATTAAAPPVLDVRNLRCTYGDFVAVDEVSLSVHAGEVYAVLGVNGAGKTTMLETVQGQRRPSDGEVLFSAARLRTFEPFTAAPESCSRSRVSAAT